MFHSRLLITSPALHRMGSHLFGMPTKHLTMLLSVTCHYWVRDWQKRHAEPIHNHSVARDRRTSGTDPEYWASQRARRGTHKGLTTPDELIWTSQVNIWLKPLLTTGWTSMLACFPSVTSQHFGSVHTGLWSAWFLKLCFVTGFLDFNS